MPLIDTKNQNKFITSSNGQAEAITAAVEKHMLAGLYAPDDLVQKAVIKKQVMKYLPFYRFSGSYRAEWAATFGYDRKEHFTVYETVHREGMTFKEPVTKAKTVTDWVPASGYVGGTFSDVFAYGGHALGATDAPPGELIELLEQSDKLKFSSTPPSSSEDCVVEPFIYSASEAYERRAKSKVNKLVKKNVMSQARGDQQQGWSWSAEYEFDDHTFFIPVAYIVIEYEGKDYTIWIDGSDLSNILAGKLPEDSKKKSAVRLGLVPFISTLIAILGFHWNMVNYEWSWLTWTALSTSFGYWFLRKNVIAAYSEQRKQLFQLRAKKESMHVAEIKKPFIANSAYDPFVLPLISAATIFIAAIPVLSSSGADWSAMFSAAKTQTDEWQSHLMRSATFGDETHRDEVRTSNSEKIIKKKPPKFKDYPAVVYAGPRSQDANFAGEYTLTTWDCGTSCTGGVAVSVTTGREIALPGFVSGWQGKGSDVIFRKDSRLIILAGLIDEGGQYGVHFYELVDDRFEHIQTAPAGE